MVNALLSSDGGRAQTLAAGAGLGIPTLLVSIPHSSPTIEHTLCAALLNSKRAIRTHIVEQKRAAFAQASYCIALNCTPRPHLCDAHTHTHHAFPRSSAAIPFHPATEARCQATALYDPPKPLQALRMHESSQPAHPKASASHISLLYNYAPQAVWQHSTFTTPAFSIRSRPYMYTPYAHSNGTRAEQRLLFSVCSLARAAWARTRARAACSLHSTLLRSAFHCRPLSLGVFSRARSLSLSLSLSLSPPRSFYRSHVSLLRPARRTVESTVPCRLQTAACLW